MTYLDRAVFAFPPDWERLESRQLDELRMESAGAGLSVPWRASEALRRRGRIPYRFFSWEDVAELLAFQRGTAAGRRRGFWLPTWLGDYRLQEPAAQGTSELVVGHTDLAAAVAAGEQFRYLVLIRGPVWIGAANLELHRIASVTEDGDRELVTLDGALEADVDPAETVCGPLLFVRFAEDGFDLEYVTDQDVRTSIGFTELPDEYEEAAEGELVVHLYEFERAGEIHRAADWAEDVEADGEEWPAASIGHESIGLDSELLAEPVRVRAMEAEPEGFLRRASRDPYRATFLRIFRGTPVSLEEVFSGKITNWEPRSGGRIELEARNDLRQVARRLPAVQYQRYDNRHVYRSGIAEGNFLTETTVGDFDSGGDWIEAAAFGDKATAESDPEWFVFGTVRVTVAGRVQLRRCRFADGNRLYLSSPVVGLAVGQAVSASAGYDRSIHARRDKFGDLPGFVGFPYMPSRNLLLEPLERPEEDSGRKK